MTKYQINLECELCHMYVIYPLHQLKDGGLFLDKLKCINCQNRLIPDVCVSNDDNWTRQERK